MMSLITTFHLIVAFVLIFLVLIQDSKGAMGDMMEWGSNTLFSATGATSFIVKLTRIVALVFAGTCIVLTIMSSRKSDSVVDDYVPTTKSQATSPATEAPKASPTDKGAEETGQTK